MREASDLRGFPGKPTDAEIEEKRKRRAVASRERIHERGQLTHRERQAEKK